MTKKLICLIISATLVFSMLAVPARAVTKSENQGYLIKEEFEGDSHRFDNVEVTDGAAILGNSTGANPVWSLTEADVPSKFVVEFDIQCSISDAEIYLLFKDSDHEPEPYSSIMIVPKSYEAGTNYTYRFIIDQSKLVRSNNTENFAAIEYYRAEKGTDEWIQGVYAKGGSITSGYAQDSSGSSIRYVAGTPAIRYLNNYAKDIPDKSIGFWLWSSASTPSTIKIDNVKVMARESFVGGMRFVNSSDETLDDMYRGEVTPVFIVENYSGLDSVDAITAVFDENNRMISSVVSENIALKMGANEFYGATVNADGGKRVEAYIWTSVSDMIPLSGMYGVLGEADGVSASETTAFLGINSDEIKTNSFEYIDRQVIANQIIIEGMHSSAESVPVTVKVEGKTSGDALLFAQFDATTDGSFKKIFEINPDLCENDSEAVVTLSGVDTTSVSFEIPVSHKWAELADDFSAMDENTARSYFETYEKNLTVLESGNAHEKTMDISGLSDEDYELIAFVKNHNGYADTSYPAIVLSSVSLVECLGEVETFESAFAVAKNDEDAASIRELLEGCSFMEFSTTGVSNVDAIALALISSDAENLVEIYEEFKSAYNAQKSAEEATVPGFTENIFDGADLKQFFADNEAVLGVAPETYSEMDYEVMFVIYDEKNYDQLTTYTQVNEAIVFLDNYIGEYNRFMTDIKDAATEAKDWEIIRTILNGEYEYIEIELADETAVVSKEYLYKRLIDMSCESLWTIETDFASAVVAQKNYEIAAKDAYNTIMDENAIKAMFLEYGDMMELGKGKDLNDVQRAIFLEVYKRFNLVASDYTQTVAHLNTLFGKLENAEKLVSDINVKAESSDWRGLKAIYEGDVYSEYVGADVSTPLISDIRSMYMRIVEEAPFESLLDTVSAFDTAYANQQTYEDVAGGYESFEDEEFYFDDASWTISISGNVVNVSGKVAGNGERNLIIAVYDETNPMPMYFKQIVTNIKGQFAQTIVLNPALYNADDEATLKIGGDGVNTYAFSPFELHSAEELETVVTEFLSISSKAKMKKFFEDNGELLGMDIDASDDRVMEALFFLYDRDKKAGLFKDIEDVTDVIKGTEDDSGMEALMVQTEKMIACLESLTEAANEKNGSGVGRWSKIKTQVELAIDNGWISPTVSGKISSESALYGGMTKKDYDYMSQVEDAYEKAWSAALVKNESGGSGGGSSGGGGITGGSTSNGGSGIVQSGSGATTPTTDKTVIGGETTSGDAELSTNLPEHPVDPFRDITSEYSWAKTSINKLRNYGLVKGDGNGNYRPGDSISREEFLTMLLDVFGVERKSGSLSFGDVKNGAWYYDTVYTAYEMGIVNGYNDATFGIGDPISRADMSVMVCRMLEHTNISLVSEEKSVVFYDYADIPEYAYSSVQKLQRANILNGDAFGNFNPKNKLTRAEAAVVLWPIFDNIKDLITYSWTKTY